MKKSFLKIISAVTVFSLISVPCFPIAENDAVCIHAQAEKTRTLSSISVYSGKSRNIEVTVPVGYEYSIDDIEDLKFSKCYEVSHINKDGEKVIDYYDHEYFSLDEIKNECNVTAKLNNYTGNSFIVSAEYTGDEETDSLLVNSLWVKINYDFADHSVYGDNYIDREAVFCVKDDENKGNHYHFYGGEEIEECKNHLCGDAANEVRNITVTEDNCKFLLDNDAFYIQAEYNFAAHCWYYNKTLKADTVTTEIYGTVDNIDEARNVFQVNFSVNGEEMSADYPIDAEYVYIPEDLDIGNNVIIRGYNVDKKLWFAEPHDVFVEPSHKVTISGDITEISGYTVTADFYGMKKSFYVSDIDGAFVGGKLYVKNYGDCIDDGWFENPIEVWVEKAPEQEILYGDATCNGEVDIRDISAVAQHIVKAKPLSEQGIRNCDFFGTGDVNIKSLSMIKRYITKDIAVLERVNTNDEADDICALAEKNAFITPLDCYYDSSMNTHGRAFTEYAEFEEYINGFRQAEKPVFSEMLNLYDEEFFKENVLFIRRLGFGSSGYDLTVNSVTRYENGNFSMNIDNNYKGDVSCCVMTGCFAGFTLPKSCYNDELFTADIHNVHSGEYTSGIITDPE